jgi:hypothetical protein
VREHRIDQKTAVRILEEKNAGSFHFTDDGLRWGDLVLEPMQIAHARETFALSYGSCSFDEPMRDLKGLGLV